MSLEESLEQLKRQYLHALPDKKKQIITLWISLRKNWQSHMLSAVYREVHNLKGSCETFGLTDTKEIVDKLELLLKNLLDSPAPALNVIKSLDTLFHQLLQNNLRGEPAAPVVEAQMQHSPYKPTKARHEYRIAIIEDDNNVGAMITKQLHEFGFNVQHFLNFTDFLDIQKTSPFDLILLDLILPDYTEEALFTAATEFEKHNTRVFVLSSRGDFEMRLLAIRANVSEYFVKPAETTLLVRKIHQWLKMSEKQPLKILLVDDQQSMVDYFSSLLRSHGLMVKGMTKPEQVLPTLEQFEPDLFIFDLYMPDVNGLELAKMIRQLDKYSSSPILVLSSDDTMQNKVSIIQAGSDDLISKQTAPSLFVTQVISRAQRGHDIRSSASRDSLTGLLNHTQILVAARRCFNLAKRINSSVCIAMLDLDHFKQVNDTYGHSGGDKVLLAFAHLLQQSLRPVDFMGRYGGEEFMLVLPDLPAPLAIAKLNAIRESFSHIVFVEEGAEFKVTLSGGLAFSTECSEFQDCLLLADKNLYEAKRTGRNRLITTLIK
ncbi:diguanylate cyclase response regulator [Shewanella bicestrii]|uniref:diguanylate cyclase n=1 Tax=Shewanella bicestrii TaxID=2018305 RepID=A0A220UMA4_9GAMM|nr:diguanylate cyclase [Shewanella bicestrii]ASK69140.1 diguanylate cyclase response regulator [Shewanella bicestrii]